MPRLFVPTDNFEGDMIRITGDDARHISRALRMARGEHITVCDMKGYEHDCVLEDFDEDVCVTARILSSTRSENEPPYKVTLYQGSPKGDKLEYITQKAVELGVYEIVPFLSDRCVSRPDSKSSAKKAQRLTKIAKEAAKQCGRAILPEVTDFLSFGEMLRSASECELKLFLYEGDGTQPLPQILAEYEQRSGIPSSVAIVIGSEGGFSLEETRKAREADFVLAGLGKRILRTETASGCVLSCLMYRYEL